MPGTGGIGVGRVNTSARDHNRSGRCRISIVDAHNASTSSFLSDNTLRAIVDGGALVRRPIRGRASGLGDREAGARLPRGQLPVDNVARYVVDATEVTIRDASVPTDPTFDAFVSYGHAADHELAAAVRRACSSWPSPGINVGAM